MLSGLHAHHVFALKITTNIVKEPKVCEQIYKPINTCSSLMPKQLQKTG